MMMMRRGSLCMRNALLHSTTTKSNHTTAMTTPIMMNNTFHTNRTHHLVDQTSMLETPLEWRQSIIPNQNEQMQIMETVLFKHPTYEQVLQVKQARYSVQLKIQKRTMEILKEKEDVLRDVQDPFERRQVEEKYAEKLSEMKRTTLPDKTLSAEQIAMARELYAKDPYTNTTQALSQRFGVKPLYVLQVVDNLILESRPVENKKKRELAQLKKRNQNKPKKSTRKIHQQQ